MKKQYYTFFALLFGIFSAYSQYTDNYNLLTCSGKVPQDWQVSVSQKFEDKKVQKTGGSRSERATKANKNIFYLETTFSLDNMLRSGWVLYNDPISMYLEKIKTELQKKNPDIPKNIRIYTLRSPEVNAFATDGGVIFVTMGLMAKVQNEAELALILGHEIGHVMKQHSLNKYLEARNIAKENQGSFSQDIYEKKMLKYHSYAKENETEADALGLNFVLKTEYATRSLENVYEMLRLANIPFADSPFPKKMLETDFMKIRKDIFVPKVLEIKGANESESDSMSTHPNIAARKALLKNSLEKTKKGEGKLFLVSEQEFNAARLQARFELPMAYIDSECYEEALYVSAHLLQKYPKNIYLKKTAAKALYQLAKRNTYSDVDNREEFAKTEGELQQVYALMQNASKKEFHIFATNYLWRLMQDYPQEVEISLMCKELMVEMKRYISQESFFKGFEHWQAAQDGKSEKEEAIPKSEEEIEMEKKTAEALDKLTDLADMKWVADSVKKRIEAEILKEKEKMMVKFDQSYLKYAFVEYVEDTAFINLNQKARQLYTERKEYLAFAKTKKYEKKMANYDKKGWKMGLENVVLLAPHYWTFHKDFFNPKANSLVLTAEKKEQSVSEMLRKHSQAVGINLHLLGEKKLKDGDTEAFNDYVMVNRWIKEALTKGEMNLMPMYHDELMKIAAKYNTDQFVYTNIVSIRNSNDILRLYYSLFVPVIFVPPLAGILVYEQYKHHYRTTINSYVLNAKTGDIIPLKKTTFTHKDTDDFLNAHIYDLLLQLHKNK